MKRFMRSSKGFTLLEVLIVIVILAVLAGLAVPVYTAQVEKSRAQEAIQMLEALRGGMLRFFASNNVYTGATIRTNTGVPVSTDIDVDANNLLGGQNQLFDYTFPVAPAAATFRIRATRIAGRPAGAGLPAGMAAGTGFIEIDQTGSTANRSAHYA